MSSRSASSGFVNKEGLFDPEAYYRSGHIPWTIFAYPTSLSEEDGLPPDSDVKRLFAKLKSRGFRVGIWANGVAENTTYLACPKEDIQRVNDVMRELEDNGTIEKGFCANRSEKLFALEG